MVPCETCAGRGNIAFTYILPSILPIAPLSRISPSKFHLFRNCKLRACLESNRVSRLLPRSPSSYCGTVIHNLIGKANSRELNKEDFDKIWDNCIEKEEKQMMGSWMEMHLIPLKESIPNYELKKHECLIAVKKILSKESTSSFIMAMQKRKSQEVWLESRDRTVGGYIDAIISTDKGDIIVDYKTGNVIEPEDVDGKREISEMYRIQLKLYAALYNSVYGCWPTSLRIIGLDGSIYEVGFSHEECTSLLEEACQILININSIITSRIELVEVYKKLSSPAPKNCFFCLYRPICNSYWQERNKNTAKNWPKDARGTIKEKKILGNGLCLIRLEGADENSDAITIRGVHIERHPALNIEPDKLAVFSMKSDCVKNHYKEGPLTTFYSA